MLIAFCPYYRSNPYQRRLGEELEKLGAHVEPATDSALFLFRSAAARRADVLHVHWTDPLLLARGRLATLAKSTLFTCQLLACRLLGKRIIWTAHNLMDHEHTFPGIQRTFLGWLTRLSHRVIVHTPSAAARVAAEFGVSPQKVCVVPHANYVTDYPNSVEGGAARQTLGIPAAELVYLFFGNVRGYKGVGELIEAFRRWNAEGTRLLIVGRPINDAIDAEVRERIRGDSRIGYYPGFVPDAELQNYFNASDVVVLPFTDLLTSGSLLLVMSFAKPCIVPKVPALTEVVPPTGSIVYDPQADHALVGALGAARERRAELSEMGRANLSAIESWGWPEMARATFDAYRD